MDNHQGEVGGEGDLNSAKLNIKKIRRGLDSDKALFRKMIKSSPGSWYRQGSRGQEYK